MRGIALQVKNPDHRFQRVCSAAKCGTTTLNPTVWEEGLERVLNGVPDAPFEILYAASIYYDPMKREFVEALLLAGASADDVRETLDVAVPVTDVYCHLFFDTNVFYDRMDRIKFAFEYDTTVNGGRTRERMISAVDRGLLYLKAELGGPNVQLSPSAMTRSLMRDAYLLASQAPVYEIGSELSRETRAWAASAIKHATVLSSIPDSETAAAGQESMVKLIEQFQEDNTLTAQSSGAPISMDNIVGFEPTITTTSNDKGGHNDQ